jgi:hypothetical protein
VVSSLPSEVGGCRFESWYGFVFLKKEKKLSLTRIWNVVGLFLGIITGLRSMGQCYDTYFRRFSPIFGRNFGFFSRKNSCFLPKQHYIETKAVFLIQYFRRKYFKNHNIDPGCWPVQTFALSLSAWSSSSLLSSMSLLSV